MDHSAFSTLFLSTEAPLLPGSAAMRLALYAGWSIVLGSGMMFLSRKLTMAYRLGLSLSVMFWTLLAGDASPAHWLGLAFQSPSLVSVAVCLGSFLWSAYRPQGGVGQALRSDPGALRILMAAGIVTGWLMLIDTLALLPVSLYAWGFGSSAFAAVLALGALFWLTRGSLASALPLTVMALFAISRLPTGNIWDALLDPWLWLALQTGWLVSAVRRHRAARVLSATTHV